MSHGTLYFPAGVTVTVDAGFLAGRHTVHETFRRDGELIAVLGSPGKPEIQVPGSALAIVSPEPKPWDRVRVAPSSWEPEREPYEATVTEVYPPGHEFELMAHVLPVGQTRTNFVPVSSLTVLAHRSETPAPGVAVIDHGDGRFGYPAAMGGDEQC